MELEKAYEPQRFEPRWAEWWVESGIFHADPLAPGPRFSLAVPPPNVTGSLHIGHMLDHTVIDTATRWHRMRGDNTLFLPGTDHAGIATQMLVERSLAAEGLTRQQLGPRGIRPARVGVERKIRQPHYVADEAHRR